MEPHSVALSRSRSPQGYRNSRSLSRSSKRTSSPARGSSKILIEKLTKNVTVAHIREIFGSYGEISSIDMPMNRRLNINRGLCYIIYTSSNSANAAISHMHEGQIDGSVISVSIVSSRPFNTRKSSFSPGRRISMPMKRYRRPYSPPRRSMRESRIGDSYRPPRRSSKSSSPYYRYNGNSKNRTSSYSSYSSRSRRYSSERSCSRGRNYSRKRNYSHGRSYSRRSYSKSRSISSISK
ncbi:uncharacterized protein T551_03192 [Pneumocystis jirovecii RU7]|uniref:RRM domain-containing protein n=2 Tax=Pneumocystis jirovecii TaxID=42068 RepID=A0A0W4ZFN6_PNEJ7|nr:uncharacterized protein T551_03192 [Pneumocystis jirovecii RU7]KTW27198.1 hypothetical protein T551_03192 [Pneumocystis jirovecii RU7]